MLITLVVLVSCIHFNFEHFLFTLFFYQEFAGEDNSDLFLEERETSIRQAQEEKRKIQMAVPGIIGPHEIPEDMQD